MTDPRNLIRAQSKTVADHIAADPEAQAFTNDWTTSAPIPTSEGQPTEADCDTEGRCW